MKIYISPNIQLKYLLTLLINSILVISFTSSESYAGKTLEAVKSRGHLRCGVNTGLPGFAMADPRGIWRGLDADLCRAIAVATLGDSSKVKFIPLSAQQRFTALQSAEVDVLVRNTTITLQRDAAMGMNFGPVNYYDGQGFIVHKDLKVKSALELDGATICVSPGTTTEANLADYFRGKGMTYQSVVIESTDELTQAFFAGRCDCYTADASALAAARARVKFPHDYHILPEIISKEPLAPAVRHGDDQWLDIVSWTVWAMQLAEEYDINRKNIDSMLESMNPNVQRLLGVKGNFGEILGLDNKWAYNIVKQLGNYGESFERNLGNKTKLKLSRGLNQVWSRGGILYAPPLR